MKKAIICDIDGTLALQGERHIFDYEEAGVDTLNTPVALILQALCNLEDKPKIVICSGRMDYGAEVLMDWLLKYGVHIDDLYMRKTEDYRPDNIIKREIYENELKDKYDILFVLDDRNQVVDMWRDLGLTCLQVAPGDF
jgi:hypothetical protein